MIEKKCLGCKPVYFLVAYLSKSILTGHCKRKTFFSRDTLGNHFLRAHSGHLNNKGYSFRSSPPDKVSL